MTNNRELETTLSNNINDVVIIGDGPVALLLAVKFKQLNLDKIIVVGARHGEYIRSGDYVHEVFSEVSKAIAPLKIEPSLGYHIKDVERQLYEHAKRLNIQFIKKNFVRFTKNKYIVIADKNGSNQESIKADIVFDCTGAKRAVINKFNEQNQNKTANFIINDIGTSMPCPYSALVRAHISLPLFLKTRQHLESEVPTTDLSYALTITKLRQLGWDNYQMPDLYAKPLSLMRGSQANQYLVDTNIDKIKVNIFVQVPPGATIDVTHQITNEILKLYDDKPLPANQYRFELLKPSRKHANKVNTSIFRNDTKQVVTSFYRGNSHFPIIFHAGDATLSYPVKMGKGFRTSIERILDILPAFTIKNGKIQDINFNLYNQMITIRLGKHTDLVNNFIAFAYANYIRNNNPHKVMAKFNRALETCNNAEEKALLQNELVNSSQWTCPIAKPTLPDHIQSDITHSATGPVAGIYVKLNKLKKNDPDNQLEDLKNCMHKLDKIYLTSIYYTEGLLKTLHYITIEIATYCKDLGNKFYAVKPKIAENYYQLALSVYQSYFPTEYLNEQLKLYSNLLIIAKKSLDFAKAQKLFTCMSRDIIPHMNKDKLTANEIKIFDKIYYNVCEITLNELTRYKKAIHETNKNLLMLSDLAQSCINQLSIHSSSIRETLQEKLNEIINHQETLAPIATIKP